MLKMIAKIFFFEGVSEMLLRFNQLIVLRIRLLMPFVKLDSQMIPNKEIVKVESIY